MDNLSGLIRDNFKVDLEDKIFGYALKYRPPLSERDKRVRPRKPSISLEGELRFKINNE